MSAITRATGTGYLFPIQTGNSGKFLTTDGSVLSWVTIGAGGGVTGSGTTNYLSKWTSGTALGNSLVFDNGTNVLVNTTTDQGQKFQVNGDALIGGLLTITGSSALPVQTATYIRFGSGFSSPVIGRMYIGDGTGWKFHMSKRISSTTTDLITFFDNGSIQTTEPTGYTAKPWKLGDVFSGTITPDRHIMVEINGNIYTIPALLGTP